MFNRVNAFNCESVKTGTIAHLLAKRMSAQKPSIEISFFSEHSNGALADLVYAQD